MGPQYGYSPYPNTSYYPPQPRYPPNSIQSHRNLPIQQQQQLLSATIRPPSLQIRNANTTGNGTMNSEKDSNTEMKMPNSNSGEYSTGKSNANGGTHDNKNNSNGNNPPKPKKFNLLSRAGSLFGGSKARHNPEESLQQSSSQFRQPQSQQTQRQPQQLPQNNVSPGKLKYREKDAAKLMKMGFTKDQSIRALIEHNHSVDQAANSLLGNQSQIPTRDFSQYN